MTSPDRGHLRRELRQQRHQLSNAQQLLAARQLYRRIIGLSLLLRSHRIAFYFANDGEVDPLAVLYQAQAMGKRCYLPIVSTYKSGMLAFAEFRGETPLQLNQWGIPEPRALPSQLVSPRILDLVFVPLVGFDGQGNRLGMGKGFYDRTFGFRNRSALGRPKLIGLAHDFQKVESLPVNSWDIPLDGVVTDRNSYFPQKRKNVV